MGYTFALTLSDNWLWPGTNMIVGVPSSTVTGLGKKYSKNMQGWEDFGWDTPEKPGHMQIYAKYTQWTHWGLWLSVYFHNCGQEEETLPRSRRRATNERLWYGCTRSSRVDAVTSNGGYVTMTKKMGKERERGRQTPTIAPCDTPKCKKIYTVPANTNVVMVKQQSYFFVVVFSNASKPPPKTEDIIGHQTKAPNQKGGGYLGEVGGHNIPTNVPKKMEPNKSN